ncbi:MAG: hypothetical protein NVS3B16_24830 [Vulcanimicrobiaceae bacterium]
MARLPLVPTRSAIRYALTEKGRAALAAHPLPLNVRLNARGARTLLVLENLTA